MNCTVLVSPADVRNCDRIFFLEATNPEQHNRSVNNGGGLSF